MNLLATQKAASLSGGFGISASASSARGKEAGDGLTHSYTHITAGDPRTSSGQRRNEKAEWDET